MRNLLILCLCLVSFFVKSQTQYPVISTDSSGQQIIIMTVEQAQALDNKTDLLPLYDKINTNSSSVDSACVKTLSDKDGVIKSQDGKIKAQDELLKNNTKQINNLNAQITNYKLSEETFRKEIENKDKEINLHLGEISRLKGRVWIGAGIGVVVGFVAGVILIH